MQVEDVTTKNFLPLRNCQGDIRLYEVSYSGNAPSDDRLIFEVALMPAQNKAPLKFFEFPSREEDGKLRVEITNDLVGIYYFRVRSEATGSYSKENYLGEFRPQPEVKLVSYKGNTEVLGNPGAVLRLESNYEKAGDFTVRLNTGEQYTGEEFGIYFRYDMEEETNELLRFVENSGRYFTPVQTTTYEVESVFNGCGQGKASGSVKVRVAPSVQLNYGDPARPGQAFCSGEEVTLSLTYSEGFPRDSLLGLYLHNADFVEVYRELATFKDQEGGMSFRVPDDLEQGQYFLQVRKRSRAEADLKQYYLRDSLATASLDSPVLPLTLITLPHVRLSGDTEIFSGESADLKLVSLDRAGENRVNDLSGVENYFTLSNGRTYSLANSYIAVSPPATETFSLKSLKNVCGTGKGYGQATVVVHPRSGKRVEALGFPRSWTEWGEGYHRTAMDLCTGTGDTLDVIFYGWKEDETPGAFKVVLSDGRGGEYQTLPVSRSEEVFFSSRTDGGRTLRLWFEIPETVAEGDSYRIKAVPADQDVPAVPLMQPGIVRELPSATLSGSVLTQAGGEVEVPIRFTGTAPWLFTVTDESDRIILNTFPTAKDSALREYPSQPYYANEYLLKLKTDKAGEYKVSRVYNRVCGYGKTEGVFKVEALLGNEIAVPVHVSLYPNPVQEILQLDLSQVNEAVRVEVFDLQGRLLRTETFEGSRLQEKQRLDLRKLAPGSYLVKLSSGRLQQTKRIIKL
ncbi:MAG: T9SS type A sorting domain-containing protein [Leadbetterella sp.]|nr:T9SS type A sorting domain-containing protein [Leadbetterella sp.]